MALIHTLSEAANIRLDEDNKGNPVVEIEFKFVRYRLVLDDMEGVRKLSKLLNLILQNSSDTIAQDDKVDLPNFYKEK